MLFQEMNLPEYIIEALSALEITEATEVQARAIPSAREGKDVLGRSATGSGKTFAYGIPAVEAINPEDRAVQVLVLCPTRELCLQVTGEMRKLAVKKEGCRAVALYGGTGMERQIADLKKGARIVVGTPGRTLDHIDRRVLKLGGVKLLVLDEADEMLSMGFQKELEAILKKVNPERQTMLFSATMPEAAKKLAEAHLKDPVTIECNEELPDVRQSYITVAAKQKEEALFELLEIKQPQTALIFCNTKRMVDKLSGVFEKRGIAAEFLHGDIPQPVRKKAMDKIKAEGGYLVATDVAARGIDVKDVDLVVNFDVPSNAEYLTHRIGRTARAGKSGAAVTIINTPPQKGEFFRLLEESGTKAREMTISISQDYEITAPKRGKYAQKESAFASSNSRSFSSQKSFEKGAKSPRGEGKKRAAKPSDFRGEKPLKGDNFFRKTSVEDVEFYRGELKKAGYSKAQKRGAKQGKRSGNSAYGASKTGGYSAKPSRGASSFGEGRKGEGRKNAPRTTEGYRTQSGERNSSSRNSSSRNASSHNSSSHNSSSRTSSPRGYSASKPSYSGKGKPKKGF